MSKLVSKGRKRMFVTVETRVKKAHQRTREAFGTIGRNKRYGRRQGIKRAFAY